MEETFKIFNSLREEFLKLKLHEAINWEKYNLMFISHHSTAIEGSTLTNLESQLLLDEGITPEGKPFEHYQMEKDHYSALEFVVLEAGQRRKLSPEFIRAVSARVMHGTGQVYNVSYRKTSVFAGETGFPGFVKVEELVKALCENLNAKVDQAAAIIHKEDRKMYISSLEESRHTESNISIRKFLFEQQIKEFERQIAKVQSSNQGPFLSFLA